MQRLLLLIPVIVLASCAECTRYAKNYVVDRETRKPIPGVQVLSVASTDGKQDSERYTYTDSTGGFETSFAKSGVAKCPVLKLTLTKTGYASNRYWEPPVGDTLVMDRLPN